jgi:hypothetical protein
LPKFAKISQNCVILVLTGKAGEEEKETEMTQSQTLYAKMISRRTAKGWNVEDSKFSLYKILSANSSIEQKIRDLMYWDFATEKQAELFLAEWAAA